MNVCSPEVVQMGHEYFTFLAILLKFNIVGIIVMMHMLLVVSKYNIFF